MRRLLVLILLSIVAADRDSSASWLSDTTGINIDVPRAINPPPAAPPPAPTASVVVQQAAPTGPDACTGVNEDVCKARADYLKAFYAGAAACLIGDTDRCKIHRARLVMSAPDVSSCGTNDGEACAARDQYLKGYWESQLAALPERAELEKIDDAWRAARLHWATKKLFANEVAQWLIFVAMLLLLVSGVVLSWRQVSMQNQVELKWGALEMKSSALGVVMLLFCSLFFYLYVTHIIGIPDIPSAKATESGVSRPHVGSDD